ncbi:MAG: endonuclease/exonuclease/phosphatase family protein [Planctomycetota bacterium]
MMPYSILIAIACLVPRSLALQPTPADMPQVPGAVPVVLRVATFNIEDVRTDDLKNAAHPRLRRLAEVIQRIRPNIILLNEIAYDMPGSPGWSQGDGQGQNGQRFADTFLSVAQASDVTPIKYKAYMAPSNTGLFSGLDLDHDGKVTATYPAPPSAKSDGTAGEQSKGGIAFAGDCWGFGTFPGQYAMALLVDERLTIDTDRVRTFQNLPWDYMPGAMFPLKPDATDWHPPAVRAVVRLSSKSHWDVPVKLPNGAELHMLCSHPTPPVFDGPEKRNARRNHDEIRFWRDYVANEPYIVDDQGLVGGLIMGKDGPRLNVTLPFVVLGDLNADPKKGDSMDSPMKLLFASRHLNSQVTPASDVAVEGLEATDTASFRLRVDYVLPSKSLKVLASGIWRQKPAGESKFPSDHFPVWMEIEVPGN